MTRRPRGAGNARGGRGGGRGGGGIVVVPTATLRGLTGFVATTNYAETANPGGIAGVASGFWFACLFSVNSQAVASSTRTLLSRSLASSTAGWQFRVTSTNTSIAFSAASGVGASTASPTFTIPAGHVGKAILAVGVHTGTMLRFYTDRLERGSGIAITGYTPRVSAMRLGANVTGIAEASDTAIYGAAGGHAVPTLAQIQQYFDDVKAADGILGAMQGVATQSAWNVAGNTGTVPDSIGADPMTITGALSLVTQTPPVFSW